MNNRKYNLPMVDLKNWYRSEIDSVGHLASMRDEYLRRRYASKVVSGMKHLADAIEEKINAVEDADRRMNLSQMRDRIVSAMEHVKADYDVSENNITYKWNSANATSVTGESMNVSANRNVNNTAKNMTATPENMNYMEEEEVVTPMNQTNDVATVTATPKNITYVEEEVSTETPTNEAEEYEEVVTPPTNALNTVAASNNTNKSLNDLLRELTGAKKNENVNKQAGGGKRTKRMTKKKAKKAKKAKKTRKH